MAVQPIPEGYRGVTAYLVVDDAAKAIDYYKQVFDATETMRFDGPNGKIGHAELKIAGGVLMLAEAYPDMGFRSPKTIGGPGVSMVIYVDDSDAVFKRAIQAGAKELRAVQNQFYGDRSGTLEDPFGHVWTIATHVEDVSLDEMKRRAAKMGA